MSVSGRKIGSWVPLTGRLRRVLSHPASLSMLREQVRLHRARMPLIYAVLLLNCCFLAFWSFRHAPWPLLASAPVLLLLSAIIQLRWWRSLRVPALSAAEMRHILTLASWRMGIMGALLLVWAVIVVNQGAAVPVMSHGGNQLLLFLVLSFTAVTVLFMHLPQAVMMASLCFLVAITYVVFSYFDNSGVFLLFNVLCTLLPVLVVMFDMAGWLGTMVRKRDTLLNQVVANERLSTTDDLTLLHNRRAFSELLAELAASPTQGVLILLDLDGFKPINDVYGHPAGDAALKIVAYRLRDKLPHAFIARIGGDEFAILLHDHRDNSRLNALADELIAAISQPMKVHDSIFTVCASLGIASQDDVNGRMDLYAAADCALSVAKRKGKGVACFYSDDPQSEPNRLALVQSVVLGRSEFDDIAIAVQPIVRANDRIASGYECLARWDTREIGVISPREFIAVAEQSGKIRQITAVVLEKALIWREAQPNTPFVSINLSIADAMSAEQIVRLGDIIARHHVKPYDIAFEITETMRPDRIEPIAENLASLRALGCRIAIDDFGAGFSTLQYVRHIRPEIIKIDASYGRDSVHDAAVRHIMRTSIEMAQRLGALTVAEGVETEDTAQMSTHLGCNMLQGSLFGAPVII